MYICMYVCMHERFIIVGMYVCMHVCMYVCMYAVEDPSPSEADDNTLCCQLLNPWVLMKEILNILYLSFDINSGKSW
jgi:hypothetical protein